MSGTRARWQWPAEPAPLCLGLHVLTPPSPHTHAHTCNLPLPPHTLPNSTPFRNSTLTFLLSDSLSNDSKTLMFANMSPLASDADETICTLTFASRVRTVELGKATRNTSSVGGGKLQGGGGEE